MKKSFCVLLVVMLCLLPCWQTEKLKEASGPLEIKTAELEVLAKQIENAPSLEKLEGKVVHLEGKWLDMLPKDSDQLTAMERSGDTLWYRLSNLNDEERYGEEDPPEEIFSVYRMDLRTLKPEKIMEYADEGGLALSRFSAEQPYYVSAKRQETGNGYEYTIHWAESGETETLSFPEAEMEFYEFFETGDLLFFSGGKEEGTKSYAALFSYDIRTKERKTVLEWELEEETEPEETGPERTDPRELELEKMEPEELEALEMEEDDSLDIPMFDWRPAGHVLSEDKIYIMEWKYSGGLDLFNRLVVYSLEGEKKKTYEFSYPFLTSLFHVNYDYFLTEYDDDHPMMSILWKLSETKTEPVYRTGEGRLINFQFSFESKGVPYVVYSEWVPGQYYEDVGEDYKFGRYYVLNAKTGEMKAFWLEMEGMNEGDEVYFKTVDEDGKMILEIREGDLWEAKYYAADAKQILREVGF